MRLRNPGAIDHAVQTIRNLQNYLGNSRGLHDGEERKDAFLNWCEDQARPNLESLLDPGEEILGELESAYHRLALAPQMTTRRLNGMLNREYTIWDQRLRAAEEEMQAQKKLAGRPGHPVVLDTSVLMEGEPFLTFGWHALDPALASEPVRLIVPILVIEELDDLLHDRNGERRQKAGPPPGSYGSCTVPGRPTRPRCPARPVSLSKCCWTATGTSAALTTTPRSSTRPCRSAS